MILAFACVPHLVCIADSGLLLAAIAFVEENLNPQNTANLNLLTAQRQQIPSQSSSTVVVSNIVKGSSTMGSLPAFTHSLKVSTLPEDEKSWPLHTPTWEPMFFNVNTGDSEQS